MAKTWDEMEPRERDAWVAEHVMGWEREPEEQHPGANVAWFKPPVGQRGENTGTTILASTAKPFTTDASADYLVLQKVRETWDFLGRETFQTILQRIEWSSERQREKKIPQFSLMYEPGDYSHAAYLALTDTP